MREYRIELVLDGPDNLDNDVAFSVKRLLQGFGYTVKANALITDPGLNSQEVMTVTDFEGKSVTTRRSQDTVRL